MSIPGIGERAEGVVICEIGVDMARFPTAKHLAAWAGGGAGQQRLRRKGNTQVCSILIEAALAASRTHTPDRGPLPPAAPPLRRQQAHHHARRPTPATNNPGFAGSCRTRG